MYLNSAARGLVPREAEDACHDYFVARADLQGRAGELSRICQRCKSGVAGLMGASAEDIAFVGSTSDAISAVYDMLDWRAGDNVVVTGDELEFPSVLIPGWRLREQGVELRRVDHDAWSVSPQRVADAVDARTRLVFVSHVSYRTGHRFDLHALSEAVRARGDVLFAADVSQSLGVASVAAAACDFAVSTAFKWTLGAHGVAVLYWNRERVADPRPPFIGWHSVVNDAAAPYALKPDAARFEAGNVAYLPVFTLDAGVRMIASTGVQPVSEHVLELGDRLMHGLARLGLPCITPQRPAGRAGIVSWEDSECQRTARALAERGIVVTGSAGRVRVSMHLYNGAGDVDALLDALRGGDGVRRAVSE